MRSVSSQLARRSPGSRLDPLPHPATVKVLTIDPRTMAYRDIGAGWRVRNKETGETYIRLKLDSGHVLFLFKNKRKKSTAHPDFLVRMDGRL